jgi:hypothetical protein
MIYILQEKNKNMFFIIFLFSLFTLVFFIGNFLGINIGDPRYFSLVYPEIALIGGYFTSRLFNMKKYLPLVLVIFFVFAIYTSMTIAISTEQSQRYPNDYVDALEWIKQNTNKNDIMFTAYGGSVGYYAERKTTWASYISEFPDIMHSTNSTYIYDTLKKYNVSYILVWRGILAEDWIIPESNIIGVFTYNFVTQVDSDKKHFSLNYSNTNSNGQQDNYIYKLL